ncbi:MAG TPA: amidohydrolase family protein [Thermoanaerobaculia bacterium]|nr:amidohydrolase family protein [Thermoanaerobaculia bacterium]
MRRTIPLLLFAFALPLQAETIVFRNVHVLPMTSERVLRNRNVVVRDGRIESVGKALPAGAKVIDGRGKWLLPGLAEMHGHIPPPDAPPGTVDDTLFLYLAGGITTVRGMLGHDGQLALREKANRGDILAPNLYLAGPSFNGNSIGSPEEAVAKVRQQKKEGWDLLKVHPGLTREEYDAMARTAREEGMRFGGHVPADVGLMHAIEMGQETFDHLDGYVESTGADRGAIDAVKLAEAVKRTREAGAWVVPTLALWEVLFNAIPLETLQSYPELRYVPQQTVDNWSKAYQQRRAQMPAETAANVIAARGPILKALHEGGVRVLMGTDAPQQFSVPGFSLRRELRKMREAGMSPYAILRSGTKNVGDYFARQDAFGTIEPGKRADLLLLDANPLEDIANVARIAGVMVRGRWLPKSEIEARLEQIERKWRSDRAAK